MEFMKHGEEIRYFAFRTFVHLSPINIFIPFASTDSPPGRSPIVLWFAEGVLEWVEDPLMGGHCWKLLDTSAQELALGIVHLSPHLRLE